MVDFNSEKVVRCFSCDKWVRAVATELVNTGEREDMERWCIGCVGEVDAYTKGLINPEIISSTLELEEGI